MPRSIRTIDYALLGYLYKQPRHGYEIYQQLLAEDGLGLVWRPKQSQLYALLTKLEQQGYITASLEPQEARPPRKILALTGSGREIFLSWLRSPVPQGRKMRLEFMAKLYFANQFEPTIVASLLDGQRDVCQAWLASLQAQANDLPANYDFAWLVCQFRMGQIEAMISWLDVCETQTKRDG